jgi:NAD(P)-dependent dehydrogenase (short-subunit alcohol dehydrogenase family)
VAVVDLDADESREAAERIGSRAIGIGADVTDRTAIEAAVAETVKRFGGLDVAVANAGIVQPKLATTRGISDEECERVFEVDMMGVWRTVRAALPQIVDRHGYIVLVSSVYAFVNGVTNSPYAAAKAGVESLGRSLRAELMPLGASAGVAYFGWIDTKMVQDAFSQPLAERMATTMPGWVMARLQPSDAGAAIVTGIEQRAPRTFAPRWWRYVSAFRGILNPLLDRGFERNDEMVEIVREVEAAADKQGAAAVSDARR